MQELKPFPFSLVQLLEPGPGFMIKGDTFEFVPMGSDGTARIFMEKKRGVQVHRSIDIRDHAVAVSTSLRNGGPSAVSGIDVIEPLHLVFRTPSQQWRHIYAHGGTTEAYYPPLAYRTHESTHRRQTLRIESHPNGRSSNQQLPFLLSLLSRDSRSEGLFCGMEWSSTWYINVDKLDEGRISLRAGIKVSNLELAPGEVLELPRVHLGFFKGGPEGGTNALRHYLYEQVCPLYQGKPVLPRVSYDHWFGIGNNLKFDEMKRQAARAADLGIEVFAVDAAWFPGNFPNGVGNWHDVDRKKFPDGLEPLAEHVRGLGMDFGLWFEIERAHEGTHALREHPEYFIPRPATYPGRNSAHLNLARRDAQDWVIATVGDWIERLDLRWSRWDYNIEPQPYWEAIDPSGKIQFEYMAGLYRVLDTLMSEHPNWMVEGCASGGRRIDIGTMKRAHTFWFSDHSSVPAICRYMQARANRFLPGHLLNSSVAVEWEHGDAGFDDTAVLSRMLGKLAFDGDIASWSPALTARMARWVHAFKEIRHLLVQDFYQILPVPTTAEDADVVQFVSPSKEASVVFAFSGTDEKRCPLSLRGLNPETRYIVSRAPDGRATTQRGAELMGGSLALDMAREEAALWKITEAHNPDDLDPFALRRLSKA